MINGQCFAWILYAANINTNFTNDRIGIGKKKLSADPDQVVHHTSATNNRRASPKEDGEMVEPPFKNSNESAKKTDTVTAALAAFVAATQISNYGKGGGFIWADVIMFLKNDWLRDEREPTDRLTERLKIEN